MFRFAPVRSGGRSRTISAFRVWRRTPCANTCWTFLCVSLAAAILFFIWRPLLSPLFVTSRREPTIAAIRSTFQRLVLNTEARADLAPLPLKRILAIYHADYYSGEEDEEEDSGGDINGEGDIKNFAKMKEDTITLTTPDNNRPPAAWASLHRVSNHLPLQHPLDGYYDTLATWARHRQARLARAYGIGGFLYIHKWGSNGSPRSGAALEAMLADSEPDIPFALLWQQQQQQHAQGLVESDDGAAAYTHFEYVLRFFRNKNYILRENKPFLAISSPPPSPALLIKWRKWATAAGFDGLFIVAITNTTTASSTARTGDDFDAIVDWKTPPDAFDFEGETDSINAKTFRKKSAAGTAITGGGGGGSASGDIGETDTPPPFYYGVRSHFSGTAPSHPAAFRVGLHAALSATAVGDFVVVDAWNDWRSGAVIEPSAELGYAWLTATRAAVRDDELSLLPRALTSAGVPSSTTTTTTTLFKKSKSEVQPRICIIVRVRTPSVIAASAAETGILGSDVAARALRRTIRSLQRLRRQDWRAWVVDTGIPEGVPAFGIPSMLENVGEPRISFASEPPSAVRARRDSLAGAARVDAALAAHCVANTWSIVTDAGTRYSPDALDFLPPEADAVIMNAHQAPNPNRTGGAASFHSIYEHVPRTACCTRSTLETCSPASPRTGFSALSGIVAKSASWAANGVSLEAHGACNNDNGGACDGGALAEHLDRVLGWRLLFHPPNTCALVEPRSRAACALEGGFWFDAITPRGALCAPPGSPPPIHVSRIDWPQFFESGAVDGCVCESKK